MRNCRISSGSGLALPGKLTLLIVICLALGVTSVWAQSYTATLTGTVVDESGATMLGAKVTVINTDTAQQRDAVTNSTGHFVVPALPPGMYTVRVEHQGFAPSEVRDVPLSVNDQKAITIALKVGSVKEAITVQEGAPLIESETSSVGQVIDNVFNKGIPLNGRDFSQLILLVPGANSSGTGGGMDVGSGISVSGRDNLNNFMFDGASNNSRQYGNIAIKPSIDAIQEFKVQSNMYSAEFGQAAFAQINLISKNGTNQLHGSAFEFVRNDVFDARNYFSKKVPKLRRNQFGGSIGGPIWKNHTFFFVNYEGTRERRGNTFFASVPPDQWRNGDFSYLIDPSLPVADRIYLRDPSSGMPCSATDQRGCFPGNRIPTSRFVKPAQVALNMWPKPNVAGAFDSNNLFVDKADISDNNQETFRIDHELTKADHLSGRYSMYTAHQVLTNGLPGFEFIHPPRNQSLAISDTHIFTPAILLQYQFSFTRSTFRRSSPNQKAGFYEQFGINSPLIASNFEGAPYFVIDNSPTWNFGDDPFIPLNDISNEFTHAGSLTWNHGEHTLKFGGSVTKYQQNTPGAVPGYRRGQYDFSGDFTGLDFADFLLGLPITSQRVVGTGVQTGRSAWQSYYFQDDWKVTHKLTLNLGLRYDYTSPLVDVRDRRSVFYPLTNDYNRNLPGQIIVANSPEAKNVLGLDGVGGRALYKPDRTNFAPRFGFGYAFTPKTVLRGGYGIFYANVLNFVNNFVINRRQPPYAQTQVKQATNFDIPDVSLLDPFAGAGGPSVLATQNIDPQFRDGYIQQWNLTFQREFADDTSVDVGYVGNKGTALSELVTNNVPTPGPRATIQARRPFPLWGAANTAKSYVTSNYNSLQAKLQKRFSRGFSLLGSYTWAKSIDLSSERGAGDRAFGAGDQRNLHSYFRGLSAFDVRHRFVVSYVYELPFGKGKPIGSNADGFGNSLISGWEVSGITAFQAGTPFTVLVSGDPTGDGLTGDRPDWVSQPKINPGNPNCYIVWSGNPACGSGATDPFKSVPAGVYRYGSAGRNILIGPGSQKWDVALMKNQKLGERFKLQFRAEAFNLFNHTNWGGPNRTWGRADFGKITGAGLPREMQFGMRLDF